MPRRHFPVHRARLMRKNHQRVTRMDRFHRHIFRRLAHHPVRRSRHPLRQRIQHRRSFLRRVLLQHCTPRQHQHDDRPRQILAEDHRGNNRDQRQNVRIEPPAQNPPGNRPNLRPAPQNQRPQQRPTLPPIHHAQPESKRDVQRNPHERQYGTG